MTNNHRAATGRAVVVAWFLALVGAFGCGGASPLGRAAASSDAISTTPAAHTGVPVVVSCEPNQRALVRPSVVDGVATSQIECVSIDRASGPARQRVSGEDRAVAPFAPAYLPAVERQDVPLAGQASEGHDARVIPVSARAVPVRHVLDDDRPARTHRPVRTVKKSAIIIGSSAGAAAGVGAAVGGRKGALLGAVIGGGGAAIWDQVTRRK